VEFVKFVFNVWKNNRRVGESATFDTVDIPFLLV